MARAPNAKYDPAIPNNNLTPLPPKADLESKSILKTLSAAARALAYLDAISKSIPDATVVLRGALLQEAKQSSEIENIVTTNDRLYQPIYLNEIKADSSTKEVLCYSEALWRGYELIKEGRPLSATLFIELVLIVKQSEIGIRSLPGTYIGNPTTKKVIYTPPDDKETIQKLLDNISEFIYANDELDPLIKLAVVHYQFEAIHPFSDGNGRVGRLINILLLVDKKLLEYPILYLSRYLLQHRDGYYDGLLRVTTDADWENWILYMLAAMKDTAEHTVTVINGIRNTLAESTTTARASMGRRYSKELIELTFESPILRIADLEKKGIAKRQTAVKYFEELRDLGLGEIVVDPQDRRAILYKNTPLLEILTS